MMNVKRVCAGCIAGIVFLAASPCAHALTGRDVAENVYHRDDGDDAFFKTRMILISKNGKRRERFLKTYVKDDSDGLVKTFLEFQEPPDIEGTRFLSWENQGDDDTQYLYLPALGRARRIVSSQKSLAFVNTDFSYEDLQRRLPGKDEHKLLPDVMYLDRPCYQMESFPKDGTSQYGRRLVFVDKESWVVVAVDFFDKKARHVKTLRVKDLRKIDGVWTPMIVIMDDLKAGHQTEMRIESAVYNQGVDDAVFSLRYLERK